MKLETKKKIAEKANKTVSVKFILTLWLNFIIISLMQDKGVYDTLPIWAKYLIYSSLTVVSILFSVDVPGLFNMVNSLKNIITDANKTPLEKLHMIEEFIMKFTNLWSDINLSAPNFDSIKEKAEDLKEQLENGENPQ